MKVEKEEKVLKLYSESIRESVVNWIEQDIILPDTKPDAIKIISANVNPYITEMEVQNGTIKVNLRLNYFIIYKANDTETGIRGLLYSSQNVQILNIKSINKDMLVNVIPTVKNVIFALPNERKISVKAEVAFNINAMQVKDVPLIESFKNIDGLQTKMKEEVFNNILETKCQNIISKDDIMLEEKNFDFGEILKVNTKIINEEYKQSYNKLLVKGDINVRILYYPIGENVEIKNAELQVPFTSMVEFSNIRDDSLFDLKYNIKDFNIKLNTDITSNKTVSVDYNILLCAVMYEKKNIKFIDDFYSYKNELEYEVKKERVIKSKDKLEKYIEIKTTVDSAVSKDYTIVDYDVDIGNIIVKENEKNLNIDGNLKINILSQNYNSQDVESRNFEIAISEKIDTESGLEIAKKNSYIIVENTTVEQNAESLNIKLNLKVVTVVENIIDAKYIEDIDISELNEENLDSMSIYIVKPKDTLWSIAKKYKTTVEKIAEVNNIEDVNVIKENQKLLIIR